MEYVATTKFEGMFVPIYVDDLDGAHAITTNLFAHYDKLKSEYQIVLNRELINKEDEFIKYVFNHELGHLKLCLKRQRKEFLGFWGLFNEELYCDVYSLRSMNKYNIDFINYLYEYESSNSISGPIYEQRLIYKYMKLFIKHNIYNNIDDILTINFDGIF